jgi:hypothetical protein
MNLPAFESKIIEESGYDLFRQPEDFLMKRIPTHEEFEQRPKNLEKKTSEL